MPRYRLHPVWAVIVALLLVSALASGGPAQASPSLGAGAPARPVAASIAGVDSMWVWAPRPAAVLAPTAQTLHVTRVFLYVGSASHEADRVIVQSVRLLHRDGIEVFALSGEPDWTVRHRPALQWARRALALAPFDGLHLDVEPHALKPWKSDQQRLVADYLGLLDVMSPLRGSLDVDVQFAYGQISTPDGLTFADDILQRVDGVTVMSYRDTAGGGNGMLAIAQDWLQRATAADKPVWLAAETNEVPGCSYCTFFEEGQADMASVLAEVDSTERAPYPTYQGLSIEDLDGWLALGP